MIDEEDAAPRPPRRTGRERKQATTFIAQAVPASARTSGRKRKSAEPEAEEEEEEDEDEAAEDREDEEDEAEDDDQESEEEHLPPAKKRKTSATKSRSNGAPNGAAAKKQPNGRKKAKSGAHVSEDDRIDDEEEENEADEQADPEEESFAPTKKAAAAKRVGQSKQSAAGAAAGRKKAVDKASKGKRAEARNASRGEVKDDNALFNALTDASEKADLAATLEDWVLEFSKTGGMEDDDGVGEEAEGVKVAEMVEFLFRCCGLNEVIDADVASDWDGIETKIEDILDALTTAKEAAPAHPLISRDKQYKSFRSNLDSFLHHLVINLSTTSLLFVTNTSVAPPSGPTTPLIQLVLHWLTPMSLSPYRGIRHTATYIALSLTVAISQVTKDVSKSLDEVNRQLEAERRKGDKDKEKGKAGQKRKEAQAASEKTKKEVESKKAVLEEYLKETFDGIFVHRYRDADATIRADCLRSLGFLLKQYPDHWVNSTYLTYLDWALTDHENVVRHEAIKALQPIYEAGPRVSNVRSFTGRVVPRLIEMSVRDINMAIRVQAVRVLAEIQKTGLLSDGQETQQDNIACLIYDKEPRVRKAAADFVRILWEDRRKDLVNEEEPQDEDDEMDGVQPERRRRHRSKSKTPARAEADSDLSDLSESDGEHGTRKSKKEDSIEVYSGWKTLAVCLMAWSRRLQLVESGIDPESQLVGTSQKAAEAAQRERDLLATLSNMARTADSHAWTAVEALWTEVPHIQDWKSLIKLLLLDHSKPDVVINAWALTEEEEIFLLDTLNAIVRKAQQVKSNDASSEPASDEVSRVLINSMTGLLAKNQDNSARLTEVLRLMSGIQFEMYKELRLINQYQIVWTEVSRQYATKSDPIVLQECLHVIRAMSRSPSLQEENADRFRSLGDSLAVSLRDALRDQDVATLSFEDEEILAVEAALSRISGAFPYVDLRNIIEAGDGEGDSGLFHVVLGLVGRGRLGYRDEVKLVQAAMEILFWFLSWTAVRLRQGEVETPTDQIVQKRDEVFSLLSEYVAGHTGNALEGVMDHAFLTLLKLHVIFRPNDSPAKGLSMDLPEMIQHTLSGHVEAVVERYREIIRSNSENDAEGEDGHSQDEDEENDEIDGPTPKRGKLAISRRTTKEFQATTIVTSAADFHSLIWTYITAMRAGVVDAQHAAGLLKYYGQTDEVYDNAMTTVVEVLQDEGQYNQEGELVGQTMGQALQDSFTIFLDSEDPADLQAEPTSVLALAKAIQSVFFVHKGHGKAERKLDANAQIDFHETCVKWILAEMSRISKQEKAAKDKVANGRLRQRFVACLSFFRVLSTFTPALTGRGALRIKNTLTETLTSLQLEPDRRKAWDYLANYDKRLVAIASADKQITAASKKQARAAEIEDVGDEASRASSPMSEMRSTPAPAGRPRPKPRLAARSQLRLARQESPAQHYVASAGAADEVAAPDDLEAQAEDGTGADRDQQNDGLAQPFQDDEDLELPDPDAEDAAALAADDDDRASQASIQSYNQIRPRKRIRRL